MRSRSNHPRSRCRGQVARSAAVLAALVGGQRLCRTAIAGTIVTDSSLGHAGATLAGPNYHIGPGVGRIVGSNLFQSFKQFDLASGDTASFTGPTSGTPITNVLARVTGGQPSMINGTLQCNIPNATFYLIDPSGVIFGPTAQINVQASFAVTTADSIQLGASAKGQFRATDPGASVLTSAAPAAFGFLQRHPASVTLQPSATVMPGTPTAATLQVNDGGNALSIVAGGVNAGSGQLLAYGGAVNIASVGSPGTVVLNAASPSSPIGLRAFSRLGSVLLDNEYVAVDDCDSNNPNASFTGTGAGRISIRAAYVTLQDSTVFSSEEYGAANGGGINLDAAAKITFDTGSFVLSETIGSGNCGNIDLAAGSVILRGGAFLQNTTAPEAPSPTNGNSGNISIAARNLTVEDQAYVETQSVSGSGTAGAISVNANTVLIDGDQEMNAATPTGLFSSCGGSPKAGTITLRSARLSVLGEGQISASTLGAGAGGDILVKSNSVLLNGEGLSTLPGSPYFATAIGSDAELMSLGAAGNVTIDAGALQVLNTAFIGANTSGSGNAGQINVRAGSMLLNGAIHTDPNQFTGITVATKTSTGSGGSISVDAGSLRILPGAQISAKTGGPGIGGDIVVHAGNLTSRGAPSLQSGIDALSTGTGSAGSVTVAVKGDITLADGLTATDGVVPGNVSASAMSSDAGTVSVSAGGAIDLLHGAVLTNAGGSGGNINIKTPDLLYLSGGQIQTNAGAIAVPKPANGGNISIDPAGVILRNSSTISANAIVGNGGNISIRALIYAKSSSSAVTATGGPAGLSGQISVTGSDEDLANSLTQLPGALAGPVQLQDRCGAAGASGSSFTVGVLGAPPPEPGGWAPSTDGVAGNDSALNQAAVAQARGDYRAADNLLSDALDRARRAGDRAEIIALLNARAGVSTLAGWFAPADRDLKEARDLAAQSGDKRALAAVLNNRGNFGVAQQQYAQARTDYGAGLALVDGSDAMADVQLAARIEVNAALAAATAGDFPAASASNAGALRRLSGLPDTSGKAFLLVTAGNTARQLCRTGTAGNAVAAEQARKAFSDALTIARAISDQRVESAAAGYWGSLEESMGHYESALDLTRRAVLAAQQDPYTLYRWEWQRARVLEQLAQPEESLASRRRAVAALSPALRGGLSQAGGNRAAPFVFRQDAGPLLFQTADVLLRRAAAEPDAQRQQPLLVEARDVIELLKGAEVQDYLSESCVPPQRPIIALAPHTAVIYIVPLPDRTELLVDFSDGLQRVTTPVSSAQLSDEVHELRLDLEDRTSNRYRRPAGRIYQQLIAPIEPLLAARQTDTLVFVPDGALRTIPMSALCYGEKSEHFLIEKYAVAVSPGLRLMDHKVVGGSGSTLLGGLSEASPGFAPLGHVAEEIGALDRMYPGRVLLDRNFRLDTLRQSLDNDSAGAPYSIVHLATHGQFGHDAADTFLLTYRGRLSLRDLQAMIAPSRTSRHPVELLTLSACETAAGDDRAALGLAGVAVKSGARTAVATLWCVSDEASSELIQAFYAAMRNDPALSKAKAMQKAQVQLCNQPGYRHPYYWGPYLVIGNWL